MARTVGRVDILVDFDGNTLPEKARVIAEKAGREAGDGFNERFASRFSRLAQELLPELDRTGRLSGHTISDAMEREIEKRLDGIAAKIANAFLTPSSLDDFVKNFDRVDDAVVELRGDLQTLHDAGSLTEAQWRRFGGTLDQWAGKARAAERENAHLIALQEDLERSVTRSTESMDRQSDSVDQNGLKWKSLAHGLRQALVVIAAVAAGSQENATLGTAAGAGLVILGSAALTAGAGIGVTIAALTGLKDQLDVLAERDALLNIAPDQLTEDQLANLDALQAKIAGFDPAILSIQSLTKEFDGLGQSITNAFINGAGPTIDAFIQNTLPTLETGILTITQTAGNAFEELFARLASDQGRETLATMFTIIQQQLTPLISTLGNLGGIISGIFIAADPSVQRFLGWLERVTSEFSEWINSAEGQSEIAEWLEQGERVLRALAPLIEKVSDLFAEIVTPATVDDTIQFLEDLGDSLEFVQSILEAVGALNVFGALAAGLDAVGAILSPILDLLTPLLEILGDVSILITSALKPAFELLGLALKPLEIAFQLAAYVVSQLSAYFQQLFEVMDPVWQQIDVVADRIFTALQPALDGLISKIVELLPSPEELARIIQNEVIPAIDNFATWVIDTAVPAISDWIDWLGDLVVWLVEDLPDTIEDIKSFAEGFATALLGPIGAVINLVNWIQDLIGWIDTLNGTQISVPGGGGGGGAQFTASGGIFNGMQSRIIGEAGPEAVVPLDRELSQVDPAVRWLSAIAQGKSAPPAPMSTRSVTVAPGAIVIAGVADPEQAADAALDRVVAMAGS